MPVFSSVSSPKAGAMICKPKGKPFVSNPAGTDIAGRPARLTGTVSTSFMYMSMGSVGGLSRLKAGVGVDGVKRTSTLLKIVGVVGIAAMGAAVALSNPELTDTSPAENNEQSTTEPDTNQEAVEETIEKTEITLGNVRLYLSERGDLTNKEVNLLFTNLESAYSKLTNYFGEEAMTLGRQIDCPINIKPKKSKQEPNGMVTWKSDYKLDLNTGDVSFTKPSAVHLILRSIKEDIIAHEFVHLFLQMPMTLSLTFYEGHAHAIQKIFYGNQVQKGVTAEISSNPKLRKSLNIGLDDNLFDNIIMKAEDQNHNLEEILKRLWEGQWIKYLEDNPDFFKKFYKEIAKRKKEGKHSINKRDLLKLAEKVSPGFTNWFEKSVPTMKGIEAENGAHILQAIAYPDRKTIVLINIQSAFQQSDQNYKAKKIKLKVDGPIVLTFRNKYTNRQQTIPVRKKNKTILLIEIKDGIPPHMELEKLTIGGRDVPIAR